VATGYAFGHAAGVQSVIVKVTRTTMIIPVVAVLDVLARRRGDAGRTVHWHGVVPWFLVWFVVVAVLESVGMVPDAWHAQLAGLAVVLITVALAAIGLGTHLGRCVGPATGH
jgi:uncharacterized membrane protein YadS